MKRNHIKNIGFILLFFLLTVLSSANLVAQPVVKTHIIGPPSDNLLGNSSYFLAVQVKNDGGYWDPHGENVKIEIDLTGPADMNVKPRKLDKDRCWGTYCELSKSLEFEKGDTVHVGVSLNIDDVSTGSISVEVTGESREQGGSLVGEDKASKTYTIQDTVPDIDDLDTDIIGVMNQRIANINTLIDLTTNYVNGNLGAMQVSTRELIRRMVNTHYETSLLANSSSFLMTAVQTSVLAAAASSLSDFMLDMMVNLIINSLDDMWTNAGRYGAACQGGTPISSEACSTDEEGYLDQLKSLLEEEKAAWQDGNYDEVINLHDEQWTQWSYRYDSILTAFGNIREYVCMISDDCSFDMEVESIVWDLASEDREIANALTKVAKARKNPDPSVVLEVDKSNINLGESTTITVKGTNSGGLGGQYSSLSISFPNFDTDSSGNYVLIKQDHSFTGEDHYGPEKTLPGDEIWHKDDHKIKANYLLLEGGIATGRWALNKQHYFKVEVTPQKLGTFPIYYRTTFTDPDSSTRFNAPSSSSNSDQQGYYVKKKVISVEQNTGSLQVSIEPAAARRNGAKWRVTDSEGNSYGWFASGYTKENLPLGNYTVRYKSISGWNTPGEDSGTIESNTTKKESGDYSLKIPDAPSNLSASGSTSSRIDLNWTDNSGNEDGFRIYRNGNRIKTVGSNATSYSDTGLDSGTEYCYRVSAYNSAGESSKSNQACATTNKQEDTNPPNPDRMSFSTNPHSTGPNTIEMEATNASDPEGNGVEYKFRETTGGSGGSDSNWRDGRSWTDSGLSTGTEYCYQVKARDKSGNQNETSWSDKKCATTSRRTITVNQPNGGENWKVGTSHTIKWNSTNAGKTVRIQYSNDGGSSWSNITSSTNNDGSYDWTPGTSSNNCLIKISSRSYSVSDKSDNTFTVSEGKNTPPELVTDFNASDGEDGKSTLTWTNPSDSDLAKVVVRRKSGSYPNDHADGTGVYSDRSPNPDSSVTKTDKGLTNGETYYYAVFAKDSSANWNDIVEEGNNADLGEPKKTDQPVNFPDENLEKAIRDAIDKPSGKVYPSDLEGLTKLSARDSGISDLTGLEYCKDLKKLDLFENNITDLTPLTNSTNLEYINLTKNDVSDISPLSGLFNLRLLYLYSNEISTLPSLSGLTSLKYIYLSDNNITDLTPLANLTSLQTLKLDINNITDLTPLANLTSLQFLSAGYNDISDISPLKNLSSLETLRLPGNSISDLTPLASLINLGKQFSDNEFANSFDKVHETLNRLPLNSFYEPERESWLQDSTSPLLNNIYPDLDLRDNQITNIQPLVENEGLGDGKEIDLRKNYLDLSEGSTDLKNIKILIDRGATIKYEPQKETLGSTAKFRVTKQGNVYADKAFHGEDFVSGNADLAEKVKVTEQVEAGDVLSLDPTNPEQYQKCSQPYSNLAAGVVSTQPGMTLGGEVQSSKATIALMGTVPVKVTTENGPIHPGDLLTTSSRSGYAMVCNDANKCSGAIVGKALEGLTDGAGRVKVLVMN